VLRLKQMMMILSPAILILATILIALDCTHLPRDNQPTTQSPECIYAPAPPEEPPEDPFEMDHDNDGMTEEQRMAFIRRGVAATVQVRTRRYTAKNGYTFHSGSGVFIDETHVLTAGHVVHNTVDIFTILRRIVSGRLTIGYIRYERVTLLAADEERDVALLQVHCPAELAYPLPVAQNWTPQHGELLWQFGNRTGWARGRVVRQIPDNLPTPNRGLVEMRMLGQGGDSGGPVVNLRGEIVGLVLRGNSEVGRQLFVPIDAALRAVDWDDMR
jgi:hypothetical protein